MIKVHRAINGALSCIQLHPKWGRYIDITHDVRYPHTTRVEYVREGFVRLRFNCLNTTAPEQIIDLLRRLQNGHEF